MSQNCLVANWRCGTLLLLALLPTAVLAQQVPDAGAALRQNEQIQRPALPQAIAPSPPSAAPSLRPSTGPTLVVQTFTFEGNTRFSDAELQPVVAAWRGRPVTLANLEAAAALVAAHYRAAGWLARVFLPPQEVEGGTVRFKIVEAKFGATRFSDGALIQNEHEVRSFMAQTDPRYVWLTTDTSHLTLGGMDPLQIMKDYWPRVAEVHYKDAPRKLRGGKLVAVPKSGPESGGHGWFRNLNDADAGGVDFPAIHQFLIDRKFSGWVTLDLDASMIPKGSTMEETLKGNLKYLVDVLHVDPKTV